MGFAGEVRTVDNVPAAFADTVITAFQHRTEDIFSFALSGGETARHCYERLAKASVGKVDWWKVDFYWGDERCVPHDQPESNYHLAREALLDRIGAANATHLMRCGEGPDGYHLRLGELGGLDIVHLGLGADGHTASLFPGSAALDADPGRLVAMNEDPLGNNPFQRMTLTFAGIARAKMVIVTVSGSSKRDAMERIAAGEDLPGARISADQVIWLVDSEAAPKSMQ